MPNPQAIDFDQIADGVTAVLNERAQRAQAHQREVERLATEQARRDAERAAEHARAQRETALAELAALETSEAELRTALAEREKQMRSLWSEILELRTRFQTCLAELQRKREKIGL